MTSTAPVFDVQRFSLHDGPGIRTLVFLKGCNLACPWCQNPESQSARPVVGFHSSRCLESFDCSSVCPDDAILRGGYRVDHDKCSRCGVCIDACANGALRLIGDEITIDELMMRITADRPYYDKSGGGVTFSGGEPTVHVDFLRRMLERCVSAGIHTNIETSGQFSWRTLESVLQLCDLIYFDLKILDPALHRQEMGGDLTEILDNASHLVSGRFPVEFRMPVVPGHTDTSGNIAAAAGLLQKLGRPSIHLLPYHNMGESKIDIIDGAQSKLGLSACSVDRLSDVSAEFNARGISVRHGLADSKI